MSEGTIGVAALPHCGM